VHPSTAVSLARIRQKKTRNFIQDAKKGCNIGEETGGASIGKRQKKRVIETSGKHADIYATEIWKSEIKCHEKLHLEYLRRFMKITIDV
jgi:hypothetical protein